MTRRRLWLLTTACCAALALPTVVRLLALVAPVDVWRARATALVLRATPQLAAPARSALDALGRGIAAVGAAVGAAVDGRLTPAWLAEWRAARPAVLAIAAIALAIGAVAVLLVRWRRGRRRLAVPRRVHRLARRGTAVSVIAARTTLAQDAVRQLLRPHHAEAFADLLDASLDPLVPSLAGSRRDS